MSSNNRSQVALRALLLVLTVLACSAAALPASAQSNPVGTGAANPTPIVMLLVDTSGSMERMPNTDTRTDALPDCSLDEKNRWAVTLESLTGTFGGFGCIAEDRAAYDTDAYDYGYFLPHHRPTFTSQTPTGILDTYSQRAKFGLMTFDPVATYVAGPIFVDWTVLNADPDNESAPGMYSYGMVRELKFPNCGTTYGIDNGARNENAPSGRLISPGPSENAPDVAAINQAIQEALLGTAPTFDDGVRPFGGTPIAGMLDDLEQFFENDADLSVGTDPYASCRERTAILITDGVPDSDFRDPRFDCDVSEAGNSDALCPGGECACPYDLPVDYIDRLCTKDGDGSCSMDSVLNRGFHVVALSLADDEDAVALLDELAEAGGTEEAHLASDGTDLDDALAEIIDYASAEATTRVSPVTGIDSDGNRYELRAGFSIPRDGGTWQGVLERTRFVCVDGVPTALPPSNERVHEVTNQPIIDVLQDHLDTMSLSARDVQLIAVPQANAFDFVKSTYVDTADAYDSADITNQNGAADPVPSDSSGNPLFGVNEVTDVVVTTLGNLGDLSENLLAALGLDLGLGGAVGGLGGLLGGLGDLDGDDTVDASDASAALEWLVGENGSRESKMGAVYHSQPVVVSPPLPDTGNAALNQFYRALEDQPQVAIVATGDGLLHGFSLETAARPAVPAGEVSDLEELFELDSGDLAVDEVNPGDELWAIAPPAALGSLPDAVAGTQLLFDGSPVVRTIATARESSDANSGTTYRRIMIAALRGLPVFVAFDLTNVTRPKFMWQFAHPKLGQTTGEPVVTQLSIDWNGTLEERAIALFPGGEGESEATCDGGGAPGSRDHSFESTYADQMVTGRPRRPRHADSFRCWRQVGRYLYAVDIISGSVVQVFDHNAFAAPLTGALSVNVDGIGLSASAAYVTDEDGIVYRVDFSNPDPQAWRVEAVYDLFHQDPGASGTYGGRPATYPPVIRALPQGGQVVLLATGDVDNLTDSIAHRVASLTETRNPSDGAATRVALEENWAVVLDPAESVTGRLVYFDETVYFASFLANSDPSNLCSPGESRIWGVDHVDDDDGAPVGRLPNLADSEAPAVTTYDRNTPGQEFLGETLLVGLALSRQPTCVASEFEPDPFLGTRFLPESAVAGGGFSLTAVANGAASGSDSGSSFTQVDVDIAPPSNLIHRITGGFGSVLE